MIRDVSLEQYLPGYLKTYREIMETLRAENPEFHLFWRCANQAFENAFIDTADEYGIGRLEKMLGILPMDTDTLEIRRLRVKLRWNNTIPYTLRALKNKLAELVGDTGYLVDASELDRYKIGIDIINQEDELCLMVLDILYAWIPANMDLVYRSVRNYFGRRDIYAGAASVLRVQYTARPMTMNKRTCGSVQVQWKGSLFAYTRTTFRPQKGGLYG